MILTFTTKKGVDYVSKDFGRPIVQAAGGCRIMYTTAQQLGGISISDKPMPGWSKNITWNGNYINPNTPDYGSHGQGRIDLVVMQALGFDIKSKSLCWSSGYGVETFTGEEARQWYNNGGGQNATDQLKPKVMAV